MRYTTRNWACVLALPLALVLGCGSSTPDGAGGSAGSGGAAGSGGVSGTGGVLTTGLWTGSGVDGPAVPFDICFNLNEEGTALTAGLNPDEPCHLFSFKVSSTSCGVAGWSYKPDIPIVDDSFSLVSDDGSVLEISGAFDGNSASGAVVLQGVAGPCPGNWEASPAP